MIENYINKHTVLGMMSNHCIPFEDFTGFYKGKKRDRLVVFNKDFSIEEYKEINYFYISSKLEIKNKYYSTLLVSNFDEDFFKLKGKESREIRETRNKYNKSITIKKDIDNIEEVISLIDEWDELSGFKYKWQRHSGYDRSFFLKYYEQEKKDLISLFFYCGDKLVGYSVVSNLVEDNCFKYVIRKFNNTQRNMCLYIDFKSFENLYDIYGREYFINWGASAGNVLKYKKKFPIHSENKVWFYKVKKVL